MLRCTRKYICPPGNFKIDKSGSRNRVLQLCFQQSAGNSTGPEINVAFCAVWNLLLD
jgi:hypothetical protein